MQWHQTVSAMKSGIGEPNNHPSMKPNNHPSMITHGWIGRDRVVEAGKWEL
jgi:hypothetical protein